MSSRIEVVGRVSGRRRWTLEQKLTILREAFTPGASVRDVLERYEIHSGLLYTWRLRLLTGRLVPGGAQRFAEVRVADPARTSTSGLMAIDLPTGVRVSVDAQVDADALARVLGALAR